MSKIPSLLFQIKSLAGCLGDLTFFVVPEEVLYYFFSFLFNILWSSVYLTNVPWFWWKDLVYDYFFPLKKSCALSQIWFFLLIFNNNFSQLLLSTTELTKYTPIILMENCNNTICSSLSILFLYSPSYKAWIFENFVLELKAFSYNFKINRILLRFLMSLTMVVSPAKIYIFFLSCLHSINLRIDIN